MCYAQKAREVGITRASPEDSKATGRLMSRMECNSVRVAYIHKAEHLDERKLMLL